MHRSGTSLTAQLCHEFGWPVSGTERVLQRGDEFNPRGYWEPAQLVSINEILLRSLGGNWRFVPQLSANWNNTPRLDSVREQAREFVQSVTTYRTTWKDPRLTLTLPFWYPLLPSTRFILCFRHPLDVAHSLQSRDHMDPDWSLTLWLIYTTQALLHTRHHSHLPVFYEDLIGPEATTQLQRLKIFLETDSPSAANLSLIRQEFSHGTCGLSPLTEKDNTPALVRTLWNELLLWRAADYPDSSHLMDIAQAYHSPSRPWRMNPSHPWFVWMAYEKMMWWEERSVWRAVPNRHSHGRRTPR